MDGVYNSPPFDEARHPEQWLGEGGGDVLREFVAGDENVMAGVAVDAVVSRRDEFQPVVFYGPSGSGKSHLALGAAREFGRRHPRHPVTYLSAVDFARQYAAALNREEDVDEDSENIDELKRRHRTADLFVLERVEQLGGRTAAQGELSVLLDEMRDRCAAIVVTARCSPAGLHGLSPALRSRLSPGLAVALSFPARASREKILRRYSEAYAGRLSADAIDVLAERLPVSASTLLGAASALTAARPGQPIDAADALRYVQQWDDSHRMDLRELAHRTARHFRLRLADLKSPSRRRPVVAARGVAMYLARRLTNDSLDEIGAYFGGRDHATVLHNIRRTESRIATDAVTQTAVKEVSQSLQQGDNLSIGRRHDLS